MSSVQPIAVYNEFRGQLAELKQHNDTVVFDYEDPAGNKEARSHIFKLRKTKGAVDAARKAEKAASLEYGRQVDAQAKEIVAEIDGMIDVHQRPLDEIEAREKKRQAKHEANIARMQELAMESNEDLSAAVLKQRLAELESYKLGEHWEEFEIEAARVKDRGIQALRTQIERRERYETEQAELARLRREQQEREQAERDAAIAAAAAAKATQAAEERAKAELLALRATAEQAELAKAEAEAHAARAAQEAVEKAERQRKADEAHALIEAERREQSTRRRNKVRRDIEAALAEIPEEPRATFIALLMAHKIPHVTVNY